MSTGAGVALASSSVGDRAGAIGRESYRPTTCAVFAALGSYSRMARLKSSMESKRSSRFLARLRSTAMSSDSGISGTRARKGRGASDMCRIRISPSPSPGKGACPHSISYRMVPSA